MSIKMHPQNRELDQIKPRNKNNKKTIKNVIIKRKNANIEQKKMGYRETKTGLIMSKYQDQNSPTLKYLYAPQSTSTRSFSPCLWRVYSDVRESECVAARARSCVTSRALVCMFHAVREMLRGLAAFSWTVEGVCHETNSFPMKMISHRPHQPGRSGCWPNSKRVEATSHMSETE